VVITDHNGCLNKAAIKVAPALLYVVILICIHCTVQVVNTLIQVNTPSGSNNDIPLTSACWKGHCAVVDLLLEHNSNIEHRTKDGCTPLMLAARYIVCMCVSVFACLCGVV